MTVMPLAVVAAAVAATAWHALGLVLLGAAVLAAVAFAVLRLRARDGRGAGEDEEDDLPPLLLRPPGPGALPRRAAVAPAPQVVSRPQQPETSPEPHDPPRLPAKSPPGAGRRSAKRGAETLAAIPAHEPGDAVDVGNVRFHRPPEGTLQLLPGRLEILAGSRRIEEIRFVKVPGRPAAVTFGRGVGEPHTHVQLEAPTVSRLHARMSYEGGAWRIANLSGTNPVLVNGAALSVDPAADTVLKDGDEVAMGQVLFRFRAR